MTSLPDAPGLMPGGMPRLGPLYQVITTTNAILSGTITLNGNVPAEATPTPTPLPVIGPLPPYGLLHGLLVWTGGNVVLNFLLTLLAWVGIAALAYWLLFRVLRSLVGHTRTEADDIILRIVRTPLFIAITAYGVVSALAELNFDPLFVDSINSIYGVVLLVAAFYLGWRIVKEVLLAWLTRQAEESESKVDDLLVPLLNTLGPLLFFLAGLIFILQFLGVDLGVVLVSIGAVGLILGLAFQDSLSNLFSGIYLMIDPPFRENDLIILPDGKICRVQRVGLRMSQLYDMSNHALIFVPNNQLAGETVANITKPTVDMKIVSSLNTTYAADPERVSAMLGAVLESHRNILGDPAIKRRVLRKRLEQFGALAGEAGGPLAAALDALSGWESGRDSQDATVHARLAAVRKEMHAHLGEAQAALRGLPPRPGAGHLITRLQHVLGSELVMGEEESAAMDAGRMEQIAGALDQLVREFPAAALEPLTRALATVGLLDHEENTLEQQLEQQEQAREQELDGLLQNTTAAGAQVSAALWERGLPKEAARVALWATNLTVQYAEQEVMASLAGLDEEIASLIDWLHDLEADGLSKEERVRIQALFGQWGGVRMLERRRVGELRQRITRWIELKEKDTLPPSEYHPLVEAWERKLRLLSRKLRAAHAGDEEALDSRLVAIRKWIYSERFLEPLADWKLPGAGLDAFGDTGLVFGMAFYVDDIKQEHFSRQGRVLSDVLLDVYEVFTREGIEIPTAIAETWIPGRYKVQPLTVDNGVRRLDGAGTLSSPVPPSPAATGPSNNGP